MMESDITQKPEKDSKDIAQSLAKATISSIPCIGGATGELFSLVVTPSLEKRRDEWIENIAKKLIELERKIGDFEIGKLKNNDLFVSILTQATFSAIKCHQKEKREALRNAVLNSALSGAPEEDLQIMFINVVDSLTSLHVKVMTNIYKLTTKSQLSNGTTPPLKPDIIFGELKNRKSLCKQILSQLDSMGLIEFKSIWTDDDVKSIRFSTDVMTDLGKEFLKFITSPLDNGGN
ncbi:MAG: hypothetical protein JSW07_20205 [bacterium]|nr:MAG: hypothetical protein JSW07_20205 [bacterium]